MSLTVAVMAEVIAHARENHEPEETGLPAPAGLAVDAAMGATAPALAVRRARRSGG